MVKLATNHSDTGSMKQTLYGGRPAALIQYLTTQPNAVQTSTAIFAVSIEGTAQGNQRALGASGTTVQPIVTSVPKRVVDASYPRDLSATGARGHFTIRMHLCGGDCG